MNRSVRVLAGLAILLAVLSAAGCTKLKARDQLNKGVQSYKNSRYEEAIEHFKNAVSLDPSLLNARLYLATAYAQQYIPGAETEENKRMAGSAIEEYKQVLTRDPKNINAVERRRLPVSPDEGFRPGEAVLPESRRCRFE